MKKNYFLLVLLCVSCLTGCQKTETEMGNVIQEQEILEESIIEAGNEDNAEETALQADDVSEPELLNVSVDITEHYVIHKGDPSNLYHIDENNVLWGCGRNNYGQLGQGTQDYDFHEDMVRIAENVIPELYGT